MEREKSSDAGVDPLPAAPTSRSSRKRSSACSRRPHRVALGNVQSLRAVVVFRTRDTGIARGVEGRRSRDSRIHSRPVVIVWSRHLGGGRDSPTAFASC